MIACVPNDNKALDFLCENDTVEISCEIVDGKVKPIKIGDVPFENREIITRVKAYERLASKAIINCDRESAVDCLYLHPLVGSYSLAEKLVDEYIELNKDFTGEWK
jgi:6-phospho-beta-glucosidase